MGLECQNGTKAEMKCRNENWCQIRGIAYVFGQE